MNYLEKFKEKCGVDDVFCEKVTNLVNKLIDFGYINKLYAKNLYKKLYENVDTVIFGKDSSLDYKSGYFDAVRKELYLKDMNNIESFYLRMLYVFTTTKVSDDKYIVGYSTASLSTKNYKIEYSNFSINRAVISNLVCRILYTIPTALEISPTYKTYQNTFLGNKICADNDIYFLEGRLLTELCFVLNSNEEDLYINLFDNNPIKFLERFLKKNKFKNYDDTLVLLDAISKLNSNYNKLCFLDKLLDDNYINIKKNILNKQELKKYKDEQMKIKVAIKSALLKLDNKSEDDEDSNELNLLKIDDSLLEKINDYENLILENTTKFQDMLVKILINSKNIYKDIDYALKLKRLQSILITENTELNNELFSLIRNKLLNTYEIGVSNLIEKIKYSLINHTLLQEKFIKSYKDLSFRKLDGISRDPNSLLTAFEVEGTFVQLVSISNINMNIKNLHNNTVDLPLTNLGYLFNNVTNSVSTERIEALYTLIKDNQDEKNSLLKISDIYLSELNDSTLVIIPYDESYKIYEVKNIYKKDIDMTLKEIKLTDSIDIFSDPSKMPTLYNEKKSMLKRLLSILTITFWC